MLTNPPVPYDFCVGVPISRLLTVGSTPVQHSVLTPSCRWVDISTWTPTPQGCLYLGPSPSDLDNSFFAESVLTSYNFLASFLIIFILKHGHKNFLDNFLSIIYYLFFAGES